MKGNHKLARTIVATFLGQVTEWYDYTVYALVATQIARTFLPGNDPQTALLSTLAIFGVAFVARPVGGILLGYAGDRLGRKSVLVLSLLLMTFATAAIGIIPGAVEIGLAAPILLTAARLLQGLSAAGESTSSITFVAESCPPERRGFFVALLLAGNSAGALLAIAIVWSLRQSMTPDAFNLYGWRFAFLFALPLGLIGLYIRRALTETPTFERLRRNHEVSRAPLRLVMADGWQQILQAFALSAVAFVAHYLLVSYMPVHLEQRGAPSDLVSLVGAVTTVTLLITYPLSGALSDVVGRRPILIASSGALLFGGWPLFALTMDAQPLASLAGAILLSIPTAGFIACLGLYCVEFIEESRRLTTYSSGFNLSGAIFGGTSLWAFNYLDTVTGDPRMPGLYVAVAALISLASLATIRGPRAHKETL